MKIRTTGELGSAIRQKRKSLGATQKDLALASGTGLRFIGELEQGKPTCQLGKAMDVLRSLGLDVEVELK